MKDGKYFCILPWIHLNLNIDGSVHSCCRTSFKRPLGNFKHNSLEEIWNSEEFKKFRLEILNNQQVEACKDCYQQEEKGIESLRLESNREWQNYLTRIEKTNKNGSIESFEPIYLDLRFSNICNFKCRMCGPGFSTSWYSDCRETGVSELIPSYTVDDDRERLWSELISILPNIKKIYFAGGEPLFLKDHYRLLDELIKLKLFDTKLIYNTNLSTLASGEFSVLEMWKKFKYVKVSASLDGIEKKGEYIRSGLNWNEFYQNTKKIENTCPHVSLGIYWTVSVFNVFHITEAMKFFLEDKFFKNVLAFEVNILNEPSVYNIRILNGEERTDLRKNYAFFIENELKKYGEEEQSHFKRLLKYILDYLDEKSYPKERIKFWSITRKLDKIRGENFLLLFPELKNMISIPLED